MKKKLFSAIVIGIMLIMGTIFGQFAHAAGLIPQVKEVAASSHPAVPSGMKVTCMKGPDKLDPCTNCPVIQWCDYTYWAYSYIDNRDGMGIVAYDKDNNIVQKWEKKGARYVYKITVDNAAQTITFWGQANETIVMSWKTLFPPPLVKEVPASSHPAIPSGLKVTCMKGPDKLDPCANCPVIKWCDYTYWAYSYIDNRYGMAIVAYDKNNKMVQKWEKTGARYVYKITVDNAAQTVTFWGQSNKTIVMSWKELFPPQPVVETAPSSSHPAIPSGCKVTCMKGPDKLDPCVNCPVIKWCDYTYWAYSYIDNRYGMAIVAYDKNNKMVQKWEKTGARYVYKITVDNKAKTVTFWGQSNKTIAMSWKELGYPW